MKLSKRIKQFLFALAWGDTFAVVGAWFLNPRLGLYLTLASFATAMGIILALFFYLSYIVFIGE